MDWNYVAIKCCQMYQLDMLGEKNNIWTNFPH